MSSEYECISKTLHHKIRKYHKGKGHEIDHQEVNCTFLDTEKDLFMTKNDGVTRGGGGIER